MPKISKFTPIHTPVSLSVRKESYAGGETVKGGCIRLMRLRLAWSRLEFVTQFRLHSVPASSRRKK